MKLRSFTLVELIVVIAIIAILAAVVTPNAFRAIEKAKVSKAIADIRSIKNAAEIFHADVGLYPGSQWGDMSQYGDHFSPAAYGEGFVSPPISHDGNSFASKRISNWNGPYLEKWSMTPWAMPYMWDYNNWDSNNDGTPYEHIVWLDLANSSGPYDQNQKVPAGSRDQIKRTIDGNLDYQHGMVTIMNNGFYGTSVEVVVSQGESD
jgi:general secretion pathway protein G